MLYDTSCNLTALAFFYVKRKNINRYSLPAVTDNRNRLDIGRAMGCYIAQRSKGQPAQQENCTGNRKTASLLIIDSHGCLPGYLNKRL